MNEAMKHILIYDKEENLAIGKELLSKGQATYKNAEGIEIATIFSSEDILYIPDDREERINNIITAGKTGVNLISKSIEIGEDKKTILKDGSIESNQPLLCKFGNVRTGSFAPFDFYKAQSLTYKELVDLSNRGNLIPGHDYIMHDYNPSLGLQLYLTAKNKYEFFDNGKLYQPERIDDYLNGNFLNVFQKDIHDIIRYYGDIAPLETLKVTKLGEAEISDFSYANGESEENYEELIYPKSMLENPSVNNWENYEIYGVMTSSSSFGDISFERSTSSGGRIMIPISQLHPYYYSIIYNKPTLYMFDSDRLLDVELTFSSHTIIDGNLFYLWDTTIDGVNYTVCTNRAQNSLKPSDYKITNAFYSIRDGSAQATLVVKATHSFTDFSNSIKEIESEAILHATFRNGKEFWYWEFDGLIKSEIEYDDYALFSLTENILSDNPESVLLINSEIYDVKYKLTDFSNFTFNTLNIEKGLIYWMKDSRNNEAWYDFITNSRDKFLTPLTILSRNNILYPLIDDNKINCAAYVWENGYSKILIDPLANNNKIKSFPLEGGIQVYDSFNEIIG